LSRRTGTAAVNRYSVTTGTVEKEEIIIFDDIAAEIETALSGFMDLFTPPPTQPGENPPPPTPDELLIEMLVGKIGFTLNPEDAGLINSWMAQNGIWVHKTKEKITTDRTFLVSFNDVVFALTSEYLTTPTEPPGGRVPGGDDPHTPTQPGENEPPPTEPTPTEPTPTDPPGGVSPPIKVG